MYVVGFARIPAGNENFGEYHDGDFSAADRLNHDDAGCSDLFTCPQTKLSDRNPTIQERTPMYKIENLLEVLDETTAGFTKLDDDSLDLLPSLVGSNVQRRPS